MNIVIIEDEHLAYQRMAKIIKEIAPDAQIAAHHDTVDAARKWFVQNAHPDLLLLDVQLSDGTAFDLLKAVDINCPIIFTTAYDQYAIEAFATTSIDYLLKPIKKADLENALQKLKRFQHIFQPAANGRKELSADYKKRFVIRFGEHIKSLAVEDIAYCYSENKNTYARDKEGRSYPLDHNLDTLEELLNPTDFFRINRQYVVTLKAISDMRTYSKARVLIKLHPPVKDTPVVSSERAADFKKWLAGELY
ncbi:MAG: response regulator transcription factor [Flavipsychrobacter sp.]|jgi:DNA-binding LytR/AlgR family response regulator|nr:response regulator transcription factor [Flavipsychrobacter sp.]